MENYEKVSKIGAGSYGNVYKCRNKKNNEFVAIKKFMDGVEDDLTKKVAGREVQMLKQLKHPHLVNLIEVFQRKGKVHLVFEFCELTLLNVIEKHSTGVPQDKARSYIRQLLMALQYCHDNSVIHRDVKPENILLTKDGVLKLCDFGFARHIAPSDNLTDYVATRWYRAPELLVGDTKYTSAVDIWAVGCVLAELLTGKALFMGSSDLDMLYLIRLTTGDLLPRFHEIFKNNYFYRGMKLKEIKGRVSLRDKLLPASIPQSGVDFLEKCLDRDPEKRWDGRKLQHHTYLQVQPGGALDPEKMNNLLMRSSSSVTSNSLLPQLTSSTNFPGGSFSASSSPEFRYRDNQKLPSI